MRTVLVLLTLPVVWACGDAVGEPVARGVPGAAARRDASGLDAGQARDASVDAGGLCPETPCKLVLPQCGCEDPLGCVLGEAGPVCGTPGTQLEGQPCDAPYPLCAAGLSCFGFGPAGVCTPYCTENAGCDRGLCWSGRSFGVCSHVCHPVTLDGCPDGFSCHAFSGITLEGAPIMSTTCGPEGPLALGAPCEGTFDCNAGLVCIDNSCLAYCRVGEDDCPASQSCRELTITVNGARIGACV